MAERLAADKDFQEFVNFHYDLILNVQQTNSGKLLLEYFEKTINLQKQNLLLKNLKYSSNEEFRDALNATYHSRTSFLQKFPELKQSKFYDDISKQAALIVKKSTLKPDLTTADCWLLFIANLNLCTFGCNNSPYWEECIDSCYALVISSSSLCFLLAD